ncbi:MAG TPA: hypothetical protein VGF32_09060 [Streptosporangiaceae bacterium]
MRLDEAKATDLGVGDEAVAQAEQEAAEAAELAGQLEVQALDDSKLTPAQLVEQREMAALAQRRAERTRERAEAARAAQRVLALGQVHEDVTAYAAAAAGKRGTIEAAALKVAAAAAELQRVCAEHDAAVTGFVGRAAALDVEPAVPSGPRASSSHVALLKTGPGTRARTMRGVAGIQAGSTLLRVIGPQLADEALGLAAAGDVPAAVAKLAAVHTQPAPKRADRYYRAPGGHIIAQDEPVPPAFADQVRKGELRQLDEAQVEAYLAGRLDGYGG